MEGLTLSEIFTLIAAGASVAIAAVAIGLSVVYFPLANRLFRKTEETVGEIENSVNQMYGALTKLSKRSESSAAEIEGECYSFRRWRRKSARMLSFSTTPLPRP